MVSARLPRLTVCLLTHNSLRTIERCVLPALQVADQLVVVDSGSTDGTLDYFADKGITPIHRPYQTHAIQMNFAIDLSHGDWVFCLDSDEFLDDEVVAAIRELKPLLSNISPDTGYRIQRHWHVLGREVRAIYPVSSPDYPLRLFNRTRVRFNDQPVDDKATGASVRLLLPGRVTHDTFYSVHEVFNKLNSYTTRAVTLQTIQPSLMRAIFSGAAAFLKWYCRKGAWRDGAIGVVTSVYAGLYSFLKYFKAWCRKKNLPSV